MENLYNLYSAQELKYLLTLGIIMFGLCQYNKTELAWIFLIFPVIYVVLQNVLLYIHVSSALQNAPVEQVFNQQHYGLGMQPPLLSGQGPSLPQITTPEVPPPTPPPAQPAQEYTSSRPTNQSNSMGGGFGMDSGIGGSPW